MLSHRRALSQSCHTDRSAFPRRTFRIHDRNARDAGIAPYSAASNTGPSSAEPAVTAAG